ncbi:MAG: hypothetical protein MZV63_57055 [Marinilabiliales bacterium]|nr:hypothetical protein [Marinilabiliales bacterium]
MNKWFNFVKHLCDRNVISKMKAFSIFTVFLVMAAMSHITVAVHYCGEGWLHQRLHFQASSATCGMEGTGENCPANLPGDNLKSHCCEDTVTVYSSDSNYTPASPYMPASDKINTRVLDLPVELIAHHPFINSQVFTDISPPGLLMSTAVDLSDICVFRI